MQVDRDRFMDDGYLILRNVIPPGEIERLRACYEALVERQKATWARERKPDDPPGGVWETAAQPRLNLATPGLVDRSTADTVEVWLREETLGVANQLLARPKGSVAGMSLMCSPVRDHGPDRWHRDIHPIDMAPLEALERDVVDNGPRYVQWNIPLYDDSVLWVIPGSHRRLNTEAENESWTNNPRAPLPGGIPVELRAGDGVVYINYIIHWGSNYSARLRRTIHGGHALFTAHGPEDYYAEYLSPASRALVESWAGRTTKLQDLTEAALRAAIRKDGAAYRSALEALHPGASDNGKQVLTIYLSKIALQLRALEHPDATDVPEDFRRRAAGSHPITLNWGPRFADRFTTAEADLLWQRFQPLDARLRAPTEQFVPAFQSGPMPYYFNEAPTDFGVAELVESWS